MAGKAGMVQPGNREPRLDRKPAPVFPDGNLADPTHVLGAVRCFVCGSPDQPGVLRVYPGLWAYIRFHVEFGLCEGCVKNAAKRDDTADLVLLEEVA